MYKFFRNIWLSNFCIYRFTGNSITLSYQLGLLLEHTFADMTTTFYYFSVYGINEVVTWLANCPAPGEQRLLALT